MKRTLNERKESREEEEEKNLFSFCSQFFSLLSKSPLGSCLRQEREGMNRHKKEEEEKKAASEKKGENNGKMSPVPFLFLSFHRVFTLLSHHSSSPLLHPIAWISASEKKEEERGTLFFLTRRICGFFFFSEAVGLDPSLVAGSRRIVVSHITPASPGGERKKEESRVLPLLLLFLRQSLFYTRAGGSGGDDDDDGSADMGAEIRQLTETNS